MSDLFNLCQRNDLAASYACCLDKCGSARVCRGLCRNIYVGTIFEDCAAEVMCTRPDFVNMTCLDQKKYAYRDCCLRRCRARQWSDSPSIAASFDRLGAVPMDCVKYCDAAQNVLLDKHYL